VPLSDITGNDSLAQGYSVDGIPLANTTVPISEVTNIDGVVTGDKIKSFLFPRMTQDGHIVHFPWEEPELDEAVLGSGMYGFGFAYDAQKRYEKKVKGLLTPQGRTQVQDYLDGWRAAR